jgi:hypothetical protein
MGARWKVRGGVPVGPISILAAGFSHTFVVAVPGTNTSCPCAFLSQTALVHF